jgi:hypothetical protein
MQDQPMMRVLEKFGRHEFQKLILHGPHGLSARESGAIGDPKYVRVDSHRRLTEGGIQNHVGCFPADARKLLESFAIHRHVAPMLLKQQLTGGNNILCFAVIESDGFDVRRKPFDTQSENRGGRIGVAE